MRFSELKRPLACAVTFASMLLPLTGHAQVVLTSPCFPGDTVPCRDDNFSFLEGIVPDLCEEGETTQRIGLCVHHAVGESEDIPACMLASQEAIPHAMAMCMTAMKESCRSIQARPRFQTFSSFAGLGFTPTGYQCIQLIEVEWRCCG